MSITLATLLALVTPEARPIERALEEAYVSAVAPLVGDHEAVVAVSRISASRPEVMRRAKRVRAFQLLQVSRPYGQLAARVEVDVPGGTESFQVTARVEVTVPVWVLAQSLAAGEALAPVVSLERRSLLGLPNTALRGSSIVDGRVSRRPLAAGAVVTTQNTESPRVVTRGQRVEVMAVVGEVTVRGTGQALRDGRAGDLIPVRGPGGGILQAVARGAGRVEVQR